MQKDIPRKKFLETQYQKAKTTGRPGSLENCGFGGKNKTQSFQKLSSGDIFLYLLDISATAASKLKQKNQKL